MGVIRRTLFESGTVRIARFEARPVSNRCGDVERQASNIVVLPVSGVFARHDAPGRHVTGTPSHAVLVAADVPYRVSFPGAIGDRALTLMFGHALAPDQLDGSGGIWETASHGLLSAGAMVAAQSALDTARTGGKRTNSRPKRWVSIFSACR